MMVEVQQILTELVTDALNVERHSRELTPVIVLFDVVKTAITNATEQIHQQERERVEKLKEYVVHHSDCRFLYPFDEKCSCGLAELEGTDDSH